MAAISSVLAGYPLGIARECCDPRTGLARSREFPPTVAAVVEWCDGRLAHYRALATINHAGLRAYEDAKLPQPEFSDEHCAEMRAKIAAIPKVHFQRMPGA